MAGRAWDKVTPTTVENCWMEGLAAAFPTSANQPAVAEVEETDTLFDGFTECDIRVAKEKLKDHLDTNQTLASFVDGWANIDDMCDSDQPLTDDQIVDEAKAAAAATDDANTPDAAEDTTTPPTAAEAVAGLQTVLRWAESEDTDYLTIMQMYNLLRVARKVQLASRRQKKVTDFFTR